MSIGTTTLCSECWSEHSKSDLVNIDGKLICAACKEKHLQRLHEGVPSTNVLEYAGFWIRVGAKLLDALIFGVTGWAIMFVVVGTAGFSFKNPESFKAINNISLPLNLLIYGITIFLLGRYGATPGKMICGLKVVKSNSERITYLRAFCRVLSELISCFTLCIGYIMVAFTAEKTSLHDIICNTRVIRK
jgi:uncharacterized RDD family membrane protein YckC